GYAEQRAKTMRDNDTSFMVFGSIDDPSTEADVYWFTSRETQFVTISVIPENALSDFDLDVLDDSGGVIASSASDGAQNVVFGVPSNEGHYIDFVQLGVRTGQTLGARVSAKKVMPAFPTYRLIVVGSTRFIPDSDIQGDHQ